ncbi:hypothetical protein [Aquiflexum gelatinilyticum]|uniref:ABC transporter ATPase n=1 Tax=Aquiflexum gelatinilyticum TaxID=2961943 RepID=A0A9X2SYC2_9BACT|nr:hypothetical protein [Aquiflexum gelatinilyticum]MCR9015152.1 hypothetical protein [Aquiflexum gelatinilyticum]
MYKPFDQMPAHSRIWTYTSNRKLNASEVEILSSRLSAFCEQWNTHGALMPTSYEIMFDQIIILAVDESQLGASGCSIDSSVRVLRDIENEMDIDLLNQGKVSFIKSEGGLEVNSILGIKSKVTEGILQAETIVLNPVVQSKSDLEKNWKIKAKESWLGKFFEN